MGGSLAGEQIQYSVPIEEEAPAGRSQIFRADKDPLVDSYEVKTLAHAFEISRLRNRTQPFIGTREKLPDNTLGNFVWKSYTEIAMIVTLFTPHLANMAKRNEEGLAFVGIFMKNCEEWIVTDLACSSANITSIPLYETLGQDQAQYIINQTELGVIVCTESYVNDLIAHQKEGKVSSLKNIVLVNGNVEKYFDQAKEVGIEILDYESLMEKPAPNVDVRAPSEDSLFTICYTSGTTGNPKGVMITHKNMLMSMAASQKHGFQFFNTDVLISYLPMAHMMERLCVNGLMEVGGQIGIYNGDVLKIREDMGLLRPTLFASVPRLFNRLYQAINARFTEASRVKQSLISRALAAKIYYHDTQGAVTHRMWDRLIFKNSKAALGGRVRFMVTGSAPISTDVLKFLKICFCCPIVEGYGQTENCACAFLTVPQDGDLGHVGGPMPCLEFMLEEIPEMNYLSTDKDEEGREAPRGEICVRGTNVFQGYYKNPEETAAAFDAEGWLHSGDIGVRMASNGALKIIDRKKNLFKLAQGEYIAVEKCESICSMSQFIAQIFIYGDSLQSCLVAIVVPAEPYVRATWCQIAGEDPQRPFEELCNLPELSEAVLADLNTVGRNGGLNGLEIPKKIHINPVLWTPNDLLTPTQKLKRHEAKLAFKEVLDKLYSDVD